jgi:hypothetical protein
MSATPAPLVTREALRVFTQLLVQHVAPEQVILFGSQARGNARWDSDADLLVVMPFEGKSGAGARQRAGGDGRHGVQGPLAVITTSSPSCTTLSSVFRAGSARFTQPPVTR